MTTDKKLTVFYGCAVHSLELDNLEILPTASIGVDREGVIVFVDKTSTSPIEAAKKYGVAEHDVTVVEAPHSASFFFPGFFDTHIVSTCIHAKYEYLLTLCSTLRSTPTTASLANPRCWTGSRPTPSPWSRRSLISRRPSTSTPR